MQYSGIIAGNLWHDVNSNGDFYINLGESGLVGLPIVLTKNNDPAFRLVTYADSNGNYSFGSVPWGDYVITLSPPSADWELSQPWMSNPPRSVSLSATARPFYGISSGIYYADNFGYRLPRTQISGVVSNWDGSQYTTWEGWTVYLDLNNSGTLDQNETRTVTDYQGTYSFIGLDPNRNYTVKLIPAFSISNFPDYLRTVTTTANAVVQADFQTSFSGFPNNEISPGAITGVVWNDINRDSNLDEYDPTNTNIYTKYGLAGWQVYLFDSDYNYIESTQTDILGRYNFDELAGGDYRISVNTPDDWESTTANGSIISLAGNEILTDINFGYYSTNSLNKRDIVGYVWNDDDGNGIRFTDSSYPGSGFGDQPLGGWQVNLVQNGQIIQTAFTDQNGYYSFTDLAVSNVPYMVEVEPPYNPNNWQSTFDSSQPIYLTENSPPAWDINFGYQLKLGRVSGQVWNDINGNSRQYDFNQNQILFEPNEEGLLGWKVNLYQNNQLVANLFTNSNGNYFFGAVPLGDYTVTVEALDASWQATTPASASFTLDTFGNSSNFGFTGASGTISGFLWNDANQSGQWDYFPLNQRETGLDNWTVYLDRNNNDILDAGDISTVTDAVGGYAFNNLAPATYAVRVNAPMGWQSSIPNPPEQTFTVTKSEIFDFVNFGYTQGQISNRPPILVNRLWGRGATQNLLVKGVFQDPDGDSLSGTATRADGTPLPSWLSVSVLANGDVSLNLNGTPNTFTPFYIKITATDGQASANHTFRLFPTSSGFVIDNYIAGATVFFDADKDGILDVNEPFTTTDGDGFYQLDIPNSFDLDGNGEFDPLEGRLVAFGGIDTATGLPLETPVSALPGSTSITLLTSLVENLVGQGLTVQQANTQVAAALSLPEFVDISNIDPIDATNNNEAGGSQTYAAMVQVQNVITQIAGLLDGASPASMTDIVDNVVAAITSKIQTGIPLDLADTAQLQTLIQDAATLTNVDVSTIIDGAAQVIAGTNQRIEDILTNSPASSLEEEFAKVQKVVLGETTNDLEQAAAGTKPISEVVQENTGTALDNQINNAQVLSQAPTNLSLSNASVAENLPISTEVGTFSTVDPDIGETHIYSLVSGIGSTDNDKFQIVGAQLFTNANFDFESQDTYSIRIQTSDGNGGVFQKALTINITDVNEAPTNLNLSNTSIAERRPIGMEIGTFSTIDPDTGDSHFYSLVSGIGSTDNDKFQIVGDRLLSKTTFDYESKNSYSIRVQTSDGNGGVFEQPLTINITDVNEITGTAGNNILTGTSGNDIITGLQGSDTLTGGGGNDEFVYNSLIDARDTLKDFTVGSDKINFSQLLKSLNYQGSNPILDGYIRFSTQGSGQMINIDPDGASRPASARAFLYVENITLAALNNASNFIF